MVDKTWDKLPEKSEQNNIGEDAFLHEFNRIPFDYYGKNENETVPDETFCISSNGAAFATYEINTSGFSYVEFLCTANRVLINDVRKNETAFALTDGVSRNLFLASLSEKIKLKGGCRYYLSFESGAVSSVLTQMYR